MDSNIVTFLEKFKLFRHFFQFLPHLHHSPGVEFAIAEQSFATSSGLFWFHIFDAREDGHCVTSILAALIKIVVVETWFIGEEGWQHFFYGEGTVHALLVKIALTERIEEVNDMMPTYKRVKRFKVREEEFEKTTTRKIKRMGGAIREEEDE